MLSISVWSIQSRASHCTDVVRVGKTFSHLVSDIVSVVRIEAPLQELETRTILEIRRCQSISHSHSLLFSVFATCILVPIPRHKIRVEFMPNIDDTNIHDPHSEGAVTVYGVFLEISVHFILN